MESKLAKAISLTVAGIGILIYWLGMFLGLRGPDIIQYGWLIAAVGGLLLVVAAYPIRRALIKEDTAT